MKISALVLFALLAGCETKPAPAAAPVAPAATKAVTTVATAPAAIPNGTKLKCPVSGDEFTVSDKTQQVVYEGKRYAFCCPDCAPEFHKNPAKYATK